MDKTKGEVTIFHEIVKDEKLASKYGFQLVERTDLSIVLRNVSVHAASACHLIVLPISTDVKSVKELNVNHLPMLERLLKDGSKAAQTLQPKSEIVAGYNDPPNIPYLHLHVVVLPLKPKQRLLGGTPWRTQNQIMAQISSKN